MSIKIESFEPYHIGIKLVNVNLESLRDRLIKPLKALKFEMIERPPNPVGIKVSRDDFAAKDGVKVQANYTASALNIIGDRPSKVSGFFDKVFKEFVSLGNDPDATVQFYEVVSNVVVSTDKDPNVVINEAVKLKLATLKEYPDRAITAIPIFASNTRTNEELNMIVEPSPSSPKNRFQLRILFRARSPKMITKFSSNIESIISKILVELGV